MLAYDFFGILAAAIGAYSASDVFYCYIMAPLANPFEYMTEYGRQKRWGRTRIFLSYLITNLLFLIANLTVLSYIQGAVVVSAGNMVIFTIVGGGLIYRLRLKQKDREVAFRMAGSYCGAFIFAFFAKVSVVLLLQNSQLPFQIDTFTAFDFLEVLVAVITVPLIVSTLGEFIARRRKS